MSERSKYCLIGIPDHQGVVHVGGRIGASRGPAAFRRSFFRLKGPLNLPALVQDLGDAGPFSHDIARNHRQAADLVRKAHAPGPDAVSIVVGGGHDHGYSHLVGVSEALRAAVAGKVRLGCINIDAHLDVRAPAPEITSGSPFYLALDSGVLRPHRFVEFGIQSHCNSPELWDYVKKKEVAVVPYSELRHGQALAAFKKALKKLASRCEAIVVSLDLDSAASAFAPGVSAPQSEGFSSSEIIEMLEAAGEEEKVVSLGIFELNPEHDRDEMTSRLAATASYHFLEAVARRR